MKETEKYLCSAEEEDQIFTQSNKTSGSFTQTEVNKGPIKI